MRATVDAACAIEADGVVFHVGSHLGAGFEAGLDALRAGARARCSSAARTTTWLLLENSAGAGGTIGRSLDELAALVDALDRHPAARHLPRLVPPVRLGRRRRRPGTVVDARSPSWTRGSASTGCARCTSTTRRRRSARTATGTRTCSRASSASGLGAFLAHPAVQGLPAVMETPGPDGHGPDAAEMQKLPRPARPLDVAEPLTAACVVSSHKPFFRACALERVERDRQVDDPRRRRAATRTCERRARGSPSRARAAQLARPRTRARGSRDSSGRAKPSSYAASADRAPRRGRPETSSRCEPDDESVDPRVSPGDREAHATSVPRRRHAFVNDSVTQHENEALVSETTQALARAVGYAPGDLREDAEARALARELVELGVAAAELVAARLVAARDLDLAHRQRRAASRGCAPKPSRRASAACSRSRSISTS